MIDSGEVVTAVPETEDADLRALILETASLGEEEVERLEAAVSGSRVSAVSQYLGELEARIGSGQVSNRDIEFAGVISYLLGRHAAANEYLSRTDGRGLVEFYRGQSLAALGRYDEAARTFEQSALHVSDPIHSTLRRVGAIRLSGRLEEAESLLTTTGREGATRAEYSYQKGCLLSDRGDNYGAIEYFERAVDMDPHHTCALFRLAGINDQMGNEDEAIALFERSLSKPPFFLGALINLGLMYEDQEDYSAARFCFRRVLDVYPNHPRAALFLADVEATGEMYYDEDADRRQRELDQLLQIPLSEFELSARSRNCLEQAGIWTLGDLTRVTEQELLSSKNFGETSLHEIQAILDSKSLQLGQSIAADEPTVSSYQIEDLSPQERSLRESPVSELNLSVRARKCLSRMGAMSLGELLSKSADDLMSVRNFGVTSLNEIRAKLAEQGLKLRND